jgi:hypothetical protein
MLTNCFRALFILLVSVALVLPHSSTSAKESTGVSALNNGLALTPPMGWNSWNRFGCNITDAQVRQMADAMVSSGMAAAGYQYISTTAGRHRRTNGCQPDDFQYEGVGRLHPQGRSSASIRCIRHYRYAGLMVMRPSTPTIMQPGVSINLNMTTAIPLLVRTSRLITPACSALAVRDAPLFTALRMDYELDAKRTCVDDGHRNSWNGTTWIPVWQPDGVGGTGSWNDRNAGRHGGMTDTEDHI